MPHSHGNIKHMSVVNFCAAVTKANTSTELNRKLITTELLSKVALYIVVGKNEGPRARWWIRRDATFIFPIPDVFHRTSAGPY